MSWFVDLRWAMNMKRARAWRRQCGFSERIRFDDALRPRLQNEPGKVIAYPDALYHATIDDICRAMVASKRHTPS